jgi:hypothetical protein
MLREGVVNPGFGQLHGLLRKLHAGEPVTVVSFGTSISDRAGCWHRDIAHLEASVGMLRYGRAVQMTKCGYNGFLSAFMNVVNSTWPHRNHLLVNLAVAGVPSETSLSLLGNSVAPLRHAPA